MPGFPAIIDLTSIARYGFVIQGDAVSDLAGRSVSSAGDINGDGIDDLIVGAPYGDDGGTDAGEAYIVFGSSAPFGTIDLATLTAAQGFIIQGDSAADRAGWGVSNAGDVNGDGLDDLLVGASFGDDGGTNAGEAYVIFGSRTPFGTIDLSTLTAAQGFIIQGDAAGDQAGFSVSNAGDVNGDGLDDLIVGAPYGDDGGTNAGEAYVIFGSRAPFGTIDLTTLIAAQGFRIQGDLAGDVAGYSVANAGDVNGDGIDDLIVGAPLGDDGGINAGEAYVIFGSRAGFGTIDLSTLTAAQGFKIQADVAGDYAGWSVSAAGDVNGDGLDDLIVGALRGDDGGTDAGEAYVIFGSRAGFGTIDLTTLAAAQGFVIQGDVAGDYAGWSASAAGDVNGDGLDDLIVGAPLGDDGGINAGKAYVVFGSRAPFGTIDLSTLTAAQGFKIQGDDSADLAGMSVSSAGDINGDGIDDLIVGAPSGDGGGPYAGEAYVIFGLASALSPPFPPLIDLSSLSAADGFVIQGDLAGDQAGRSVSNAGDINGDGLDDIIIGARYADDNGDRAGEAYVIFGSTAGFTSIDLSTLTAAQGFRIQGGAVTEYAGISVSAAGDVNGDGIDDIIVGASGNDDGGMSAGEAYVIFGSTAGFATINLGALTAAQGFTIQGDPGESAGFSVSAAGDFNGDGIDDLVVGAKSSGPGFNNAGAAYVIFGSTTPSTTIDLGALTAAQGFAMRGAGFGDWTGYSVSTAGDINGDGFDDILVGAPYNYYEAWPHPPGSEYYRGATYVIYGSDAAPGEINLGALSAAQGFRIQGDFRIDSSGISVSAAGDVNGDGIDDLVVGSRLGGAFNEGAAYVVFGSTDGFGTIDLSTLSVAQGFAIVGDNSGDFAGRSVSNAGDVNGDGIDDLLIGAPKDDDTAYHAGAAYVIYGSRAPFGTIDLGALTAAQGFEIKGEAADDQAGFSVSAAGDINGDGIDDLIVGAPYGDDGAALDTGAAYVIYGRRVDRGPVEAGNDGLALNEGATATITAALLDFDDPDQGDDDIVYTVTAVTTNGTLRLDSTTLGIGGTFTQADIVGGLLTYQHDGGETNADSFGFSVSDGIADAITGQTFAITITAVDDPAVANDDDNLTTTETAAQTDANVFDNDSDVDGPPLQVGAVNGSAANVDVEIELDSGARLTMRADGTYDYDPNGAFDWLISPAKAAATGAVNVSATDSFTYTLVGGNTATVTVTINGEDGPGDELHGNSSNNSITGTGGDDVFVLGQGGNDSASGLAGNDIFRVGATFDGLDSINGGADFDWLILNGDYSTSPLVLSATNLVGVDAIAVTHGHDYDITFNDANIAAGATMTIESVDLLGDTMVVDGSQETDGNFLFIGGEHSDDEFHGGAGNDLIIGGGSDNILDGNGGIDTVAYDSAYSSALGPVDVDLAAGTADNGFGGTDQLADIENVIGSDFGDEIDGNSVNNRLDGGSGADLMRGGDGNDTYVVDNAGDVVTESSALAAGGNDLVQSSVTYSLSNNIERLTLTGTSNINGTGNSLNNVITGNSGKNQLNGGGGTDTLVGGDGDDVYIVDSNGDVVDEATTSGADTIRASISYTLSAGVETMILEGSSNISGFGNGLNNIITGNAGNNTLNGGAGVDSLRGGDGNDTYFVDDSGDVVIETNAAAAGGVDLVQSSINFIIGGNVENLTLLGTANINGTGNALANVITGNSGNNTLNGGAGADSMRGGDGNDFYLVDDLGDLVIETNAAAAGGVDTVQSSVSFQLGGNVENLTLIGTAANGTGNALANIINGNTQANVLNGGAGADTMTGGLGNDTYQVDNIGDQAIETTAGGGTDTVLTSVTFTLGLHVDNLTMTGAAAINGTGNATANTLNGNGADNILDGAGGNDVINAGNGNDTLIGGAGADTLNGSTGNDDFYGGIGIDTMSGSSGSDDFFFDTALNAVTNVDAITDFLAVADTIMLDDAIFTTIAAGALAAGAFRAGIVALDADDHILYDSVTGHIRYDADGVGGAAAILFATVTPATAMTAADFIVY